MRIRVLGCGWYGAHLGLSLLRDGHDVEIHEIADRIFAGASGGNPARLHKGFHYPRSRLTRAACQDHAEAFERQYGHLTRCVPINLYCVAAQESLVDFGTYVQILRGEVDFVVVHNPAEFGLRDVEGAVLTGERHILIDRAREWFMGELGDAVKLNTPPGYVNDDRWDLTIDATFCANDAENIDRFEPCVTVLLTGPVDRAVTIMDGAFPSLFPWDEDRCLSSLTSAKLTPLAKDCRTWAQAKSLLDAEDKATLMLRAKMMLDQMERFWPEVRERYRVADFKLSIRAMPKSAADTRLVDVVRVGERAIRVRAGKIDAILHAERIVREMIGT